MNIYDHFLVLARSRRSIRKFSTRPVNREDVLRAIEAARWAPSNHNRQPWKFMVLDDGHRIARLAEVVRAALADRLKSLPEIAANYVGEFAHYATFFAAAPVLVAVWHKRPMSVSATLLQGMQQPELISGEPLSVAMAVQNFLLAAHALGLGACVMTGPLIVRDVATRELGPLAGCDLTCLIALGYPDESPAEPRRKSIEQIAEFVQSRGWRAADE